MNEPIRRSVTVTQKQNPASCEFVFLNKPLLIRTSYDGGVRTYQQSAAFTNNSIFNNVVQA